MDKTYLYEDILATAKLCEYNIPYNICLKGTTQPLSLLLKWVSPKEVMIIGDILDGTIDPIEWAKTPEMLPEDIEWPDTLDLKPLKKAIANNINTFDNNDNKQTTYVIEELSELTIELQYAIKSLTKYNRGKMSADALFDELVDVLTTVLVFLVVADVPENKTMDRIIEKLNRAIERFNTTGEK